MLREHGHPPFRVIVVHGGPGAAGDLWPVARRLAATRGVLEPMQTATSVERQVEELRETIETRADPPVVLVGHSWGAWLTCILTANYPRLVRKLVLVGSGPFDEAYVPLLRQNRLQRLTHAEREEFRTLAEQLGQPAAELPSGALERLGELGAKTDTYAIMETESRPVLVGVSGQEIYARVWPEAARMRQTGELLRLTARIECPVVAIHGAYDPHPEEGVRVPLARSLRDFRMIVLDKCGHAPWRELHAADAFYALLDQEIN